MRTNTVPDTPPDIPPNIFRGATRSAVLLCGLLEALLRFSAIYLWCGLWCGGQLSTSRRIAWLHASCARIARRLSLVPSVPLTTQPETGLIVSNHLTYLDILVFGAIRPFLFVAKSEVKRWPLLGSLATLGGTVYVDRGSSLQAAQATRLIEQNLRDGIPVLLFPEGTSSDGRSVLPFKSSLFESAVRAGAPITAAAIRYHSDDTAEEQVTYWGDMVFLPHLLRTLCARKLRAQVCFDRPGSFSDRKTAASLTRQQVQKLRSDSDPLGASRFAESPVAVVDMLLCLQPRKSTST